MVTIATTRPTICPSRGNCLPTSSRQESYEDEPCTTARLAYWRVPLVARAMMWVRASTSRILSAILTVSVCSPAPLPSLAVCRLTKGGGRIVERRCGHLQPYEHCVRYCSILFRAVSFCYCFRAYICCAIWQGLLLATCEQNLNPARHS